MRLFRIIIVALICAVVSWIGVMKASSFIWQLIAIFATGFVGAITSSAYEFINTHGQGLKTWFKSQITHREKEIFLSFSYLFKIEIDGKYLLVRGRRMRNRYQPIGGVYKYYSEAKPFLESLHYQPDTIMGNTDETDDLRIRIKGKHLLSFMDWFLEMKDREYGPEREFYEELITTGLLPEEKFKHLQYRKVDVHNVGITKSYVPGRVDEVIYADIFDVSLTDEQKRLVKEAVNNCRDELCLASPGEMKSRRLNESAEMNIGNNARWLLGED